MSNDVSILKLSEVESRELVPGGRVHFVHSQNMTFAYWDFEENTTLPDHSHPHEQVATVIHGTFDLTVEGKTQRLEPGMVAIIPPNARHSGAAITKTHIIDVFYPIRDDYR